jgi:two-component system alkaline phosphatase synthesis response regulator PhoP
MSVLTAPKPTVSPATASGVAPRVLVVDDDRDLVATLCLRLQRAGYSVLSAHDGQAGLTLALREKPEVVVLDVMMSYKDGFEVCAQLKQNQSGYRPKIIIVSAITQGTNRTEETCRAESGADAFFSKPFDAKRLIREVARLTAV